MLDDWRFARSPNAEYGGLRAYGGAVLRCTTDSGEIVGLGTLCVAAPVETCMTPEKQEALAQFADIVSAEIIHRSCNMRQRQRRHMGDLLVRLKKEDASGDAEELVLTVLRDMYPTASVIARNSHDGTVELENQGPIAYAEFENGLWEDTELLETLIQTRNYEKLTSDRTIRAIAQHCRKQPHPRYLIVASKEVQLVFDDLDAWFVEACGVVLYDFYQESLLRDALQAKDIFTKSINHHLRTPIHGVLASVEMLAEELSSTAAFHSVKGLKELSSTPVSPCSTTPEDDSHGNDRFQMDFVSRAQLYLESVRDCGRELMSTVNNMLMLNRWAESSPSMGPASLHELNQLEADMVRDVGAMLSEVLLASSSILFDCRLTSSTIVITDIGLLKQCLEALISNAIQSRPDGSVLVVTSVTNDYTVLQFDVIDSGCGISPNAQEKIFDPYEKGDSHSRGIGLGLTIASKVANALNGFVYLVSSELDKGSHFRAEFHDPGFACPAALAQGELAQPKTPLVARMYYEVPTGESQSALVSNFLKYLEYRGYERSDRPSQTRLHVVKFMDREDQLRSVIQQVDRHAVMVCLIPSSASIRHFRRPLDGERRFFIEGPFLSTKLNLVLGKIEAAIDPSRSTREIGQAVSSPQDLGDLFDRKLRITDPIHALLVDDNPINLRVLKMYCEKRGVPYMLATDGREAISHYTNNMATSPFNLVLMDLQMPYCDGIEATKRIRALERDSNSAPAVLFMITGQDSPEDKSNSTNAGADEFFVKPMSIKTLDAGVGEYFEQIARL